MPYSDSGSQSVWITTLSGQTPFRFRRSLLAAGGTAAFPLVSFPPLEQPARMTTKTVSRATAPTRSLRTSPPLEDPVSLHEELGAATGRHVPTANDLMGKKAEEPEHEN